jgi:hypothetical protein
MSLRPIPNWTALFLSRRSLPSATLPPCQLQPSLSPRHMQFAGPESLWLVRSANSASKDASRSAKCPPWRRQLQALRERTHFMKRLRRLLLFFATLFFLAPALAVAQKVEVKVIKLTQGADSITVYMYPVGNGSRGFWQAPKNDVGSDGGSHNQWKWDPNSKTVKFFDDIGLRDVRGAGHDITFENSEDMVLILKGVASFPANFKSGDGGKGEKHDKHSHGIQGDVDWKCTGAETHDMILK